MMVGPGAPPRPLFGVGRAVWGFRAPAVPAASGAKRDPARFFPGDGALHGPSGLIRAPPPGTAGEEYCDRVRTKAKDDRGFVVLGHLLDVYLSDDDRWSVAVDGQELLTHLADSYTAWAVGAAESYRLGRVMGSPSGDD